MSKYVTHYFAHLGTLERAERWLLQRGFSRDQIETHREGVLWISVLAAPVRAEEVELIFGAAEHNDKDGWPSFWDLAKMPRVHIEPGEDATATAVFIIKRSPVGWHPIETLDVVESG